MGPGRGRASRPAAETLKAIEPGGTKDLAEADRRRAKTDHMSNGQTLGLLGGGGHAAVVADAARAGGWSVAGYLDDAEHDSKTGPVDLKWLGPIDHLAAVLTALPEGSVAHAAVGDSAIRCRWLDAVGEAAAAPIIHPTAVISTSATLADGVFIGPQAIVNARAVIERGVIVNSGAIIEHDCVLGAFCHVAGGAVLGGGASVGPNALVGLNASVLPGIRIEAGATLGTGAVAVSAVSHGTTATGVPAKALT